METTRLQEAGCLHLLWLRGYGVARADRPLHGPPWHASPVNNSGLAAAGLLLVLTGAVIRYVGHRPAPRDC